METRIKEKQPSKPNYRLRRAVAATALLGVVFTGSKLVFADDGPHQSCILAVDAVNGEELLPYDVGETVERAFEGNMDPRYVATNILNNNPELKQSGHGYLHSGDKVKIVDDAICSSASLPISEVTEIKK